MSPFLGHPASGHRSRHPGLWEWDVGIVSLSSTFTVKSSGENTRSRRGGITNTAKGKPLSTLSMAFAMWLSAAQLPPALFLPAGMHQGLGQFGSCLKSPFSFFKRGRTASAW